MWFNLKFVPAESFLENASWIFRSEVVLEGVTVEQFWDYVLCDDDALQQWHPECAKIEWKETATAEAAATTTERNSISKDDNENEQKIVKNAPGVERVVTYKDWPFMILLAGPIQIYEHFDVWEDGRTDVSSKNNKKKTSADVRRFQFYFKAFSRPSFLTYTGGREEFKVEPVYVDDNGTSSSSGSGVKFTRIVALEPAFVVRWVLGFIAYPRMKYVFETKCPKRLVEAFESNKFNIPKQQKGEQ